MPGSTTSNDTGRYRINPAAVVRFLPTVVCAWRSPPAPPLAEAALIAGAIERLPDPRSRAYPEVLHMVVSAVGVDYAEGFKAGFNRAAMPPTRNRRYVEGMDDASEARMALRRSAAEWLSLRP